MQRVLDEELQRVGSQLRGAQALVTGGLGLIGSHLARRLLAIGSRVAILDCADPNSGANPFNVADLKDKVQIFRDDVRNEQALRSAVLGCSHVFHLAGQTSHADSMADPKTDIAINVSGTLNLLEALRAHAPTARVVFTSTRQIYGVPRYLPVDESHPLAPPDVNGVSKLAAEGLLSVYNRVHGIRSTALRLTNTYGPGMRIRDARQMFLGIWIRNILEARPILVFGDGLQKRDFNAVDDVANALILASADEMSGQTYNLGSDEAVSLGDLAKTLITLPGNSGSIKLVPFPKERKQIDIGDYQGDFTRFRAASGWSPRYSLAAGLAQTVAYYRSHGANYL
jgi:dTDP-glucose 4,6-dehydratase/UDP-glucose 4-epimerase